ncbi:carbohydrate kinase [Mucilaginibacter phyllosphaerae]|nr:carbohydrate kinase [Mucilaginibacter phyllosphaerae]
MSPTPVIAVFDVGKTNKKLFLFDQDYRIVYEKSARFTETVDEDGFACENLQSLRLSVFDSLSEIFRLKEFAVKAVNFSAYGASLVYLDETGQAIAPLYNYLKPYPEELSHELYANYGGELPFSTQTASPVLGSLNSGLQLYRIKHRQPALYQRIQYALHLPQYLSFLLSGLYYSDLTSIGCHTALWDFGNNRYHDWVNGEGLAVKLAPIAEADKALPALFPGNNYKVGIGLHDSSAALIPYLVNFHEPFILISTGTWCISLNPFNQSALTADELDKDCLFYIGYQGKHVKASRLFSGLEHEQQVKRIAAHFNQDAIKFRNMFFNPAVILKLKKQFPQMQKDVFAKASLFATRDLAAFEDDIEAYHQLMLDLVCLQVGSTGIILNDASVKRIFVDGGFSKNSIYMNLLAAAFPNMETFAASMAQASAVGAALSIHQEWNVKPIATDIIGLKYYAASGALVL